MVNVILAPGLLAHIRKSIIEGVSLEELAIKDKLLNERIQQFYSFLF